MQVPFERALPDLPVLTREKPIGIHLRRTRQRLSALAQERGTNIPGLCQALGIPLGQLYRSNPQYRLCHYARGLADLLGEDLLRSPKERAACRQRRAEAQAARERQAAEELAERDRQDAEARREAWYRQWKLKKEGPQPIPSPAKPALDAPAVADPLGVFAENVRTQKQALAKSTSSKQAIRQQEQASLAHIADLELDRRRKQNKAYRQAQG